MEEFKDAIEIDFKGLQDTCNNLKKAGKELEGRAAEKPEVGELSGLAGVERLIRAYQSLYDIYRKMGQLAVKDADDIQKIAHSFHQLDTSA